MTQPNINAVGQEIKDFKETYKNDISDIKNKLKDIYVQTKKTNGRVTKLETIQENCPYIKGKISQHIITFIMMIIALASAISVYIK